MEVTLTHLDGTKGVHEVLPNTDPTSGVTVFTGRPGRGGDRAYGLSQDFLGGFGVRNDIAGAGRQVSEDLLHIRARLRAYRTRLVVVRHADMLHQYGNTDILDLLADTCTQENADLALTCDDSVGEVLAAWVDARGGCIHEHDGELLSRMPTPPESATDIREATFPRSVPKGDFYVFRSRARDVLTAQEFSVVDSRYVEVAREVLAHPFTNAEEAAERLLTKCQHTDNPAEVVTILRAAQAAMFRHGLLLKVDVSYFTRLVSDEQHRPLTDSELLALRAYRTTWRSATVALLDAGMSYQDISETTVGQVADDGAVAGGPSLRGTARELLQVHREFMLVSGAVPADSFIPQRLRKLPTARRDASIDLAIPADAPQRAAGDTVVDRWRRALGVSMLPLVDIHMPDADTIKRRAKEALR